MRKICTAPGCAALAEPGKSRCQACAEVVATGRRKFDRGRQADPGRRMATSRMWQRTSKAFLAAHPFCACGAPSEVTDHIVPHKGDPGRFWDQSNWQALCKRCHDAKTAVEDGGFGNPAKGGGGKYMRSLL